MSTWEEAAYREVDRLSEELHYLKTTKKFEIKILKDELAAANEANWRLTAEIKALKDLLVQHGVGNYEPPLDSH